MICDDTGRVEVTMATGELVTFARGERALSLWCAAGITGELDMSPPS